VDELRRDPVVSPRPRSRPEIKDEKSKAKDGAEAQMRHCQKEGESKLAVDERRRYKKNFPSVAETSFFEYEI